MLNQETDALEDNNKQLDEKIRNYQILSEMNDQEKKTHISELKQKQIEIKADINNTITDCEDIEVEFNSIKDHV
jgi:hypothetical protein